jgi:exosortase
MDTTSGNGILEEFRLEFLEAWRRLPNKGFFLILVVAWLALFQFLGNGTFGYIPSPSLLRWMYLAYQPKGDTFMSDDGIGKLIPFLVIGLMWWRRKDILAVPMRTWWAGILAVSAGLMFHVIGYVVQQPRISIIGLFVGIFGFMGLAWGPAFVRASLFPYFLFLFSVPLGSQGQFITVPLQLLVCRLVELICHNLLAIDVLRNGALLSDPSGRYQYEVAAACSGMRSLMAVVLMALVYGFLMFKSPWKRLLLLISAFPLSVLGNLFRMLLIVVSAELGGESGQAWGNYVHESTIFSLLPYIPALLGFFYLGQWLERGERPPPASGQPGSGLATSGGAVAAEGSRI